MLFRGLLALTYIGPEADVFPQEVDPFRGDIGGDLRYESDDQGVPRVGIPEGHGQAHLGDLDLPSELATLGYMQAHALAEGRHHGYVTANDEHRRIDPDVGDQLGVADELTAIRPVSCRGQHQVAHRTIPA